MLVTYNGKSFDAPLLETRFRLAPLYDVISILPYVRNRKDAKLTMSVETDGSIKAEDAVALAARIIQDQLSVFINFNLLFD